MLLFHVLLVPTIQATKEILVISALPVDTVMRKVLIIFLFKLKSVIPVITVSRALLSQPQQMEKLEECVFGVIIAVEMILRNLAQLELMNQEMGHQNVKLVIRDIFVLKELEILLHVLKAFIVRKMLKNLLHVQMGHMAIRQSFIVLPNVPCAQ